MFSASRLRRLAPLAILLVVSSALTACSADMTGPSAKSRSGYITTSANVSAASQSWAAGASATKPDTATTTPVTPPPSKSGKGKKTLSSGYNVPAL